MSEAALSVRGLTVTDASGRALLGNITFDLPVGRNLVVIGESGSGKSLFASALLGLLPTGLRVSGLVSFRGRAPISFADVAALHSLWAKHLAFIPQEPSHAFDPTMTVAGQIESPVHMAGNVYTAALSAVGLAPDVMRMFPFMLSGGMAQRVLVAAASLSNATLIIADEPTKGLDPNRVEQTIELFRHMTTSGKSIIAVTHDHRLVRASEGMAAVLLDATMVEYGPVRELLARPRSSYTRAWIDTDPSRWPMLRHRRTKSRSRLAVRDLSFGYARQGTLFSGFDLDARSGRVVALTGPSGCGKTTLGNILVGLTPPDKGWVNWDGINPYRDRKAKAKLRRRYQKLHQDPANVFLPNRRIGEQLAYLRTIVPNLHVRAVLPSIMERLKLSTGLLERYAGEISGGEAQRFALCRVLLMDPFVIVADEPTSRLDPIVQRETILLLRDIVSETGLALVLISHDSALVSAVADCVHDLSNA